MKIRPIRSEAEYKKAKEEIERYLFAGFEPNTPEADNLEVMIDLVEAYASENYPLPLPDPIEAIKSYLESMGLQHKDLIPYIGSSGRVSDILNRNRNLTKTMAKAINRGLGIPLEILYQPFRDDPEVTYSYRWIPSASESYTADSEPDKRTFVAFLNSAVLDIPDNSGTANISYSWSADKEIECVDVFRFYDLARSSSDDDQIKASEENYDRAYIVCAM